MKKGYLPKCDRCFWCNVHTREITRDHVIPVSFGGGDFENIVWACGPCNNERGRVSQEIKRGRVYVVQKLFNKWVSIETRELGYSPTESLVSMVSVKSPRDYGKAHSDERGKVAEAIRAKSMKLRKCCRTFVGGSHESECFQIKRPMRACCDTERGSYFHLESCRIEQDRLRALFNPKQPKEPSLPKIPSTLRYQRKLRKYRGENHWTALMQWQDDGGANTDIGDALGEERPEMLERLLASTVQES